LPAGTIWHFRHQTFQLLHLKHFKPGENYEKTSIFVFCDRIAESFNFSAAKTFETHTDTDRTDLSSKSFAAGRHRASRRQKIYGRHEKIPADFAGKSEEEIFAEAIDSMIALLAEDKKLQKTFVGRNYIPFMAEMKKNGYTKIFSYLILQQDGNKTAEKWLLENSKKGQEFLDWAQAYKPAK
jgi:hypothetical protein